MSHSHLLKPVPHVKALTYIQPRRNNPTEPTCPLGTAAQLLLLRFAFFPLVVPQGFRFTLSYLFYL